MKYATKTRAGAVHILALDHLSLPLAMGLGLAGRKITGTLFRPSVHYRLIGSYRPSPSERFRDLRKAILYRLMLRNRSLGTVLSLDPYFPDFANQFYREGKKVQLLHDPAHPVSQIAQTERDVADRFAKEKTNFLLFGYLTERKGTLVLLDALRHVSREHRGRMAVMFAGRIDPAIRNVVMEKWASTRRDLQELQLEIEERRLSAGELEAVVQRSHVLLAPYQRFVGSSGVLLWAARAGKPILTQDFGLMGPLVREFGLGVAVDTTDPIALARAMVEIVDHGTRSVFDRRSATEFCLSHTPQAFASAIFART
jgi:glycosyltransferase involved in cell wall biosynthesis